MRALALCSVMAALALLTVAHGEEAPAVEVRRVWLDPADLPAALERARQGQLVKMPRPEFEKLLRQAARAPVPAPPRLVEARYRARLVDTPGDDAARRGLAEPYLTGSAEWKVYAPRGGPSLLPVEPLSVAPQQVRFENGEAWLGDFDGRRPSLLLEKPGHQAVLFDWT